MSYISHEDNLQTKDTLFIFTDGASKGNPGPGGYGAVITFTDLQEVIELGGRKPNTTNNEMELAAVVSALSYVQHSKSKVKIFTDSAYVFQGATSWRHGWARNGWKKKDGELVINLRLWQTLADLIDQRKDEIEWLRVPSHVGIVGNEQADKIADAFAVRGNIDLYRGNLAGYNIPNILEMPTHEYLLKLIKEKHDSSSKRKTPKEGWYIVYNKSTGNVDRYNTWTDCKAATHGKSGMKFKKVSTDSEQKTVIEGWK